MIENNNNFKQYQYMNDTDTLFISKDRILSMLLIDTSTAKDICFNDILCKDGLAKFEPDNIDTLYGYSYGINKEVCSFI